MFEFMIGLVCFIMGFILALALVHNAQRRETRKMAEEMKELFCRKKQ